MDGLDARVAAALELLADPTLLAEPDGGRWTVRWANAQATREGLDVGASLAGRYAPGYLADLLARARAAGPGAPATREIEVVRDGAPAWVEVRLLLVDGGAVVTWRDATAARLARERQWELQERLRRTIEGVDAVVGFGLHDRSAVLTFSEQAERILGLAASELSSFGAYEARVHPDDLARCRATWDGPDESWSMEYRFLRGDGTWMWLRDSCLRTRSGDGWGQLYSVLTDVTAVHAAAEQHAAELLERERIYRDLIESADVIFYSVGPDPAGGNEYISPQVQEILGYPPEAWYDPGFWMTTVHPDDLEDVLDRMIREDLREYEYRAIAADGRLVWFLERVRTIRDEEGRVTRRVGVTFDQSSRKAAEEELRASEDRFRTLVDELDAVVFAVETDGRVWVSPQVVPILGYDPADLATSADWRRIVYPDDRDRVMVAWDNRSTQRHELEYRIQRGDGEVIWVSEHLRAVRGPTGEPVRWYGLIVDITERRLLRERLLRQARLEDAGRLAAAAAHDFDNVLFGIRVHAHVLAEHEADPGRAADLERILEAAERGNALVRQLLSVGRASDAPHVPVDLAAIVARIEPLLARLAGPAVRLRTLSPDGEVCAVVDPGTVEQILCNLVLNARDAMPDGGLLTIEVASDAAPGAGDAVEPDAADAVDPDDPGLDVAARGRLPGSIARLAVHDTGTGMDPEVAAHAFEPFFTTKHEGEGSGLGLASVRHLVRAAGGEVMLYTAPGAGTTVELRLPLVG